MDDHKENSPSLGHEFSVNGWSGPPRADGTNSVSSNGARSYTALFDEVVFDINPGLAAQGCCVGTLDVGRRTDPAPVALVA